MSKKKHEWTRKGVTASMAVVLAFGMVPAVPGVALATEGDSAKVEESSDSHDSIGYHIERVESDVVNGVVSSFENNGSSWVESENSISVDGDKFVFEDNEDVLYEHFGTSFDESSSWEGDKVVSAEFYLDPSEYAVGEGFVSIVDIMPSWRAFVANVRKTDSDKIEISFSNNTDNFYVVGTDGRPTYEVAEAGWYKFEWVFSDSDGKVACSLRVNDSQVGEALSDKADVASGSYIRKFYVQTYAPHSGTDEQTCSGNEIEFRNVKKYSVDEICNISNSAGLVARRKVV